MNTLQNIGFGILGLGVISEFHVKAIEEIAGCRFVAGFDTVPGRAAAFCKTRGGRPYNDLPSFLADRDIDIVTIATPSGLHLDGAVAAIRAGKHVIVEKPLEITTARCDIEVEDTAAATIQFANGAPGVIEGTTGAYPGFLKKIEICGSKGCVTMEEESITTWQFADERPEDEKIRQEYGKATATGGGVSAPKAIVRHGHRMLFESFAEALRENRPVDIDGVEEPVGLVDFWAKAPQTPGEEKRWKSLSVYTGAPKPTAR